MVMLNMSDQQQIAQLCGELTFATVANVMEHGKQLIFKQGVETFDLTAVSRSDSAALALLLEWLRAGKSMQKKIQFKNIPEQLLALAKISGVKRVISG